MRIEKCVEDDGKRITVCVDDDAVIATDHEGVRDLIQSLNAVTARRIEAVDLGVTESPDGLEEIGIPCRYRPIAEDGLVYEPGKWRSGRLCAWSTDHDVNGPFSVGVIMDVLHGTCHSIHVERICFQPTLIMGRPIDLYKKCVYAGETGVPEVFMAGCWRPLADYAVSNLHGPPADSGTGSGCDMNTGPRGGRAGDGVSEDAVVCHEAAARDGKTRVTHGFVRDYFQKGESNGPT